MSNNLKRLVCGLLSAMMVTTSCGIAALAEDATADTTAETAETVAKATEAPAEGEATEVPAEETTEATEAPAEEAAEATEAPAEEATEAPSSNYDNDNTYNTALAVCSALGIITGYEDGSVKPEATVTRAEMATIILRMIQMSDSTYQNVFTDVSADHWAAGTIQAAVEQAIVNGMGDGTLQPDGNVKYEQVIKMIVAAMGYSVDAESAGGYPNGYISVGSSALSLLKGVNGAVGQDMPRGEVIKAVYNALMAPYRKITRTKNCQPVYEANDTLGVEKFKLYEEEGVVVSTPNGTITSGVQKKEDRMTVDGVQYKVNLTDIDKYLGTKVTFYYIDSTSDDPEVIAIVSSGKSEEVTIEADDIDTMSVYGTNGETAGTLTAFTSKTSSTTKKYNVSGATVIYNGSVLTSADYTASGNTESYDDFIIPEVGTVKIVDYDADGVYDIVFVDSYETLLVTTASSDKVNGKINNENVSLDLENDANDRTITVIKSGAEATTKNLRKNDVVSLKRNIDETIIEMIVTGETITGKISGVGKDDDDTVITVNGTEYKVDGNAVDLVKNGMTTVLYLDAFDRVGYLESSTGGNLSDSEKYAMIANAYYEDDGEVSIKLFTQDGEGVTLRPAGNMKYWGPGATEPVSGPSKDQLVNDLSGTAGYTLVDSYPVKLCKYSVNSKNEITLLYIASDVNVVGTDSDALTVHNGSLKGVAAKGGLVSGYTIQDGMVQFVVPKDGDDRRDTSNYSIGTVTASSYVNYDGGVDRYFTVGDFVNSTYPSVLVVFEGGATTVAEANYTSNASNGPSFMVSSIIEAVDSEGDTIYELKGYSGGTEVTYMTAANTGVYELNSTEPGSSAKDYNNFTSIAFDATSDDPEKFMDVVHPGDVYHVGASGSTVYALVKIADVEKVAYDFVNGTMTQRQAIIAPSATRDNWDLGFIDTVEINDSAVIDTRNMEGESLSTLAYDVASVFSYCTVTVDEDGNITNTKVDKTGGMEPSELLNWNQEPGSADFAVFKSFKGSMGAGYVIRVVME